MKGMDVLPIDVSNQTAITDMMVICSGHSSRHIRSLADQVITQVKKSGHRVFGVEGEKNTQWVLVDLGVVVVHIMEVQTRDFYQLEKLWSVDDKSIGP